MSASDNVYDALLYDSGSYDYPDTLVSESAAVVADNNGLVFDRFRPASILRGLGSP